MKRMIGKRILTAMIGLVLLFGSVVPIYGFEISQFSFDISAKLEGSILTVIVDTRAPAPAGTGTFYCYFKSGENEITDSIGTSVIGVDDIVDGTVFSYNDIVLLVWTYEHIGDTARYTLQYNVSSLPISEGSTLDMIGAGSKIGMDEGTCIAWDSDILKKTGVLASCTITNGSGNISTPIQLEVGDNKDIDNKVGIAATVNGTVDNDTATLNVSCDKACTVAYTTDNGDTYTRVDAVQADSGYNFIVPDYTDAMKFVVAVKGDANGDGNINANDLSLFVNASNGDYSAIAYGQALTLLIGDTDNNDVLNANDLSTLVNASNGIALNW